MSLIIDEDKQDLKRLARKDMHTDLNALQKEKPRPLDPEDQDTVEV